MGRNENLAVFEESRRLWETDPEIRAATDLARARSVLVRERDALPCHAGERRYCGRFRVDVSKRRSFEAAARYRDKRVCVLNFASATNPGGGVAHGASAQEECLCRCSALYPCLNTPRMRDGFYSPHRNAGDPLHNDDCIYSPDVLVFRADDETAALLPKDGRFRVDVLTCAAPNLRARPSNSMNPGDGQERVRISGAALRELIGKRVRRMLNLAAEQNAEVLILGAFGCGAFANPPELVAEKMRGALEDYGNCFETVEFAVYCPPGREENYRAFCDAFSGWN